MSLHSRSSIINTSVFLAAAPAEGPGGDSSRDNENHYRSVAEFEASGTGELSVTCGEVVTVIEKNSSGKSDCICSEQWFRGELKTAPPGPRPQCPHIKGGGYNYGLQILFS